MIFKFKGEYKYFRIGMRNRMLWLLIVEINSFYDQVYLFWDKLTTEEKDYYMERYLILKNYFNDKLHL